MAKPPKSSPGKTDRVAQLAQNIMRSPGFWEEMSLQMETIARIGGTFAQRGAQDLTALGVEPRREAIDAYSQYLVGLLLGQATFLQRDPHRVLSAARRSLETAEPKTTASLPAQAGPGSKNPSRAIEIPDDLYDEWFRTALGLVELRLFHLDALDAREKYLRLSKVRAFPSEAIFNEEQNRRIRAWQSSEHQGQNIPLDRIAGESAAEASEIRLHVYRSQLHEADERLLPRGSYLSLRTPPRNLRLRQDVAIALRRTLGLAGSELARSDAVAATLVIFAGSLVSMPPAGGIREVAVNTIERERRRVSPEVITRVEKGIERSRKLRHLLEE